MRSVLYILLLCGVNFIFSCQHGAAPRHSLNQEIKDSHGNVVLLGRCTRKRLEQAPFDSWFVKNYNAYMVDSATAGLLRPQLKGRHFQIFMGTWCGDSRREVPRIFKIFDYCGVSRSSVQLILVNNADSVYKQSPGHEERGLNIFRVPDLLVWDGNKELGRIVESPVASLEKDLLVLTGGEPYTPNYRGAAYLIGIFREENAEQVEKDLPGLADRVRPLLSGPSELSSYAHMLQTSGEKDKAAAVLKLNSLIFPVTK
jgi:hypothetical protein